MLTAALAAHPGDAALTSQLALVYGAEGKRYAQAVPLAEAMHAADANDANVTRMLAHLYVPNRDSRTKAEPLLRGAAGREAGWQR